MTKDIKNTKEKLFVLVYFIVCIVGGSCITFTDFRFWFKSYKSIKNASKHTDVESNEVEKGILIVWTDEHANVGDEDVLETTNDLCSESRVESGAENVGVDEDESKYTGQEEL